MTEPAPSLSADELAFLKAAADTMIPPDDLSPSGSDCGVVDFIAKELAGPYGQGARLYRNGPFLPGKPEQGYQLGLTPRALIGAGIAAADAWTRRVHGAAFADLAGPDRIAALQALENGMADFPDFSSKDFFEAMLSLAMEGFFSDPIHGGNRDCAAWKMIGYPGAPANYRDAIARYSGRRYDHAPQSIADVS